MPSEAARAEKPQAVEKPDGVLAGLARLRALAAQFAATPAAPAVTKAPEVEAEEVAEDASAVDQPDSEAEPNADSASDAVVDSAAAQAAVQVPDDQSEPEPTPEPEPEPELQVEPERSVESDSKAETAVDITVDEPELEAEAEPEAEPELAPARENDAVVAVTPTLSHGIEATSTESVLEVRGLSKGFGDMVAVNDIDLNVRAGVFYGIVGPNGAGKTTTLSMITGLLRPDSGTASVNGVNVWDSPEIAKRSMGVLPDRLRIFDRLTGSQLLYYSGVLRGLKAAEVRKRSADLATAFGLDDVMGRLVSDYSSGMLKKVALAAAMIHSPRLLILDEPFESVDPVSAATVTRILKQYVNAGGTVLLSSHRMELVQRVCSHVAVIVEGSLLADGTIDEVRNGMSLEDRFVQLTGKNSSGGGLEWLNSFSD
ncbi:ABC transporter ATP-binding protein [Salinibacterium sp. M195]|uniref:ABC transporter ATP-binding protein n=1 Tax=Salinibacterium sp. M195 TaxID=2583374 RepID=UPI002106BF28|nr:ABC transporter ATP-binding protein [Salinibacterium sp. M195]